MGDNQIAKLLEKYLNGTCSDEEEQVIDAWYARHEDQGKVYAMLPGYKRRRHKAEILHKVRQRISNQETRVSKKLLSSLWVRVAAAAVLVLLLNIVYFSYFKATGSSVSIQQQVVSNHSRKMMRQVLPDSSVVWLNPGSSIRVPEVFSSKTREIMADGECFFEIKKNPKRPFIIRSAHLITKVWGTTFKVIDGKDTGPASVTVVTGKVSVSLRGSEGEKAGAALNKHELILLPNDQATLNVKDQNLSKDINVNDSELKKYTRLSLKFENTTLRDMVQVLKRNFNVDMRIEDEALAAKVMDADLTELNLPEVLEVLRTSMSLDYELSGDLIVLKTTK